ncbi:transforming growth factor-beta-induced protein ig-h3 [Octopus bimaculoides]|uniref:FAS1 domain-containing protein n=1 Tax=Octopus bimaculoides TaxID=37653 RepID=A0A0L8H6A7_OCTBM|nr:transforming growth factor-beta-induced protein ig-h3 [Octopus bimaculoides]|eukprot:XP_014775042.1 PREDICTED: transforming growth factor-beta-induced protein ig-h3-like [Octopus bimaculoides]
MSALRTRPQLMKKLVNYHMVNGKVMSDQMVGQQDYASKSTVRIKVNVYRKGIMVDDARVMTSDRKSGNGVIHTIDKVLIPPEQTLMGLVQSDPTLSQFRQAIEVAGVNKLLNTENLQLTVLAPTNDAFDAMTRTRLNRLMSNPGLLEKHLQHHIVKRFVVPCGFQPNTNYNMKSLQNETLRFSLDRTGKMKVFQTPMTPLNNNTMAVNGILYKINNFLHCECNDRPGVHGG